MINFIHFQVKDKLKLKSKTGFEKFMDYAKDNIYVAGGFTGLNVFEEV